MADSTATTTAPETYEDPRVQDTFKTVHKFIGLYGVISVIVLGTVAAMAITGNEASPFMWIRGSILLLVWPLFHRMATRSAQGDARQYDRLATVTVILPIAIIVVDLIPGLCPAWYAAMQGVSALALVGAAVLTRGAAVRGVFPKLAKKKKA